MIASRGSNNQIWVTTINNQYFHFLCSFLSHDNKSPNSKLPDADFNSATESVGPNPVIIEQGLSVRYKIEQKQKGEIEDDKTTKDV